MDERTLAQAFTRFRRRGDAAALGEVFDGVAPELLRIARHLVGDAGEAEDLVQATFVTAIERAREFDAERALVPWLVGILAKHAANLRRARGRRATGALDEREPPEPRPGPAELVQQRELSAVLGDALASLPETYRTVVSEFLLAGRAPREIARSAGLSPSNARVRVHRGLELLRRALPAGFATGAAAVVTGGRGLAEVRVGVLAVAREAGPVLASAATAGGVAGGILGGVLVKKTIVVACGVLGVLALAWWKRAERAEERATGLRDVAELTLPAESVLDDVEELTPVRTREFAPVGSDVVRASGLVVEYESGAPVVGARVWSTPRGSARRLSRATVDADGRVEFELPRAELETLFVAADGFAPVAVPVTAERRARFWEEAGRSEDEPGVVQLFELRMQRGVAWSGRVVDAEGRGLAGAEVGLLSESVGGLGVVEERTIGRSGPGGVIAPDGLLSPARANERWLAYAVTPDAFGFARLGAPAFDGGHAPLEIRLVKTRALELTVEAAGGARLADVRVVLVPSTEPFPFNGEVHGVLPLPPLLEACLTATTDAAGVARFTRLPVPERSNAFESWRFHAEVWRGSELLLRGVAMFTENPDRLLVPAANAQAVTGRVLDAEGRALQGVPVFLSGDGRPLARVESGPDGGFRLPFAPDAPRQLTVSAEDVQAGRGELVRDRENLQQSLWQLELVLRQPLPLAGVVRDDQGRPRAGYLVTANRIGGEFSATSAPSDALGRFRIENASAGEFELSLSASNLDDDVLLRHETRRARGGDTTLEVVLPTWKEAPCVLVLSARSRAGVVLEALEARVVPLGQAAQQSDPRSEHDGGSLRVRGLATGRHEVWLSTSGGVARAEVELTHAGEERALELIVEPTASVHVRIDLGARPRPRSLAVLGSFTSPTGSVPGERSFSHVAWAGDQPAEDSLELEFAGLLPGPWTFGLHGEFLSPERQPLELTGGVRHEIVLVAAPGAELELDCGAWSTPAMVEFELLDPQRTPTRRWLAPGTLTWRARAWRTEAWSVTGSLVLRADETTRLEVPAPAQ
jgi:RNA polymerase sigma-70 factor (ECF subfamily)